MALLIRDIALLAVLIGGMALAAGLAAGALAGRYGWPAKRIENWSRYGYGLLFLMWWSWARWGLHTYPTGWIERDLGGTVHVLSDIAMICLGPLPAVRIAKAVAAREA